jgi:hypothetical protein
MMKFDVPLDLPCFEVKSDGNRGGRMFNGDVEKMLYCP